MNVTDMLKAKSSRKLIEFQELTCKQPSRNSLQALSTLITQNPDLALDFLRISMTKQNLPLISLILSSHPDSPPIPPLKLITYLCKHMHIFPSKLISPIWNLLYLHSPSSPHKYQIFYECLSTFPFGGSNRESQETSLSVLLSFINLLHQKQDHSLLYRISQDFIQKFKKYNVLNISYFKVMNRVIQLSGSFEGFVRVDCYEMLNKYLGELGRVKGKKWHGLEVEILRGVAGLGEVELGKEYVVGGLWEGVEGKVEGYLGDKVFAVRDQARKVMRVWNRVKGRVIKEKEEKEQVGEQDEEQEVRLSGEFKVKQMIDQTGKYLAKKQFLQKKLKSQLFSPSSSNLETPTTSEKQYLKKKTGNGGGYITLLNKPRSKPKLIKSKYESILDSILLKDNKQSSVEKEEEQYQEETRLEEYEWYPNNSHLTEKYNLEETVWYERGEDEEENEDDNQEDKYLLEMMRKGERGNVDVREIEELIDIAYSKIW